MGATVRMGASGSVYPHRRGSFYPRDLRRHAGSSSTRRVSTRLNRFVTHIKRLDVDPAAVARSYDTMAGLGPALAAVLVQPPARWRFAPERLDRFFAAVARRRRSHALEPRDALRLRELIGWRARAREVTFS